MLNIAVICLAIAAGLIAVNQFVASLKTEELRQQLQLLQRQLEQRQGKIKVEK
jgi:type II secretory pathway pseudopilin PulG